MSDDIVALNLAFQAPQADLRLGAIERVGKGDAEGAIGPRRQRLHTAQLVSRHWQLGFLALKKTKNYENSAKTIAAGEKMHKK